MASNIARFDEWRSVLGTSTTGSYVALGGPLGHSSRLIQFINGTDGDIAISFDGTTDNIPVLAGSFDLYDVTSDQDRNESFRYQKGTQIYVKHLTIPTTGTFYAVEMHGKGE